MRTMTKLLLALVVAVPAILPVGAGAQPPAPVRATLFTNVVQWQTTPGRAVRVVLRSPERVKATANVTADENGEVTAVFPYGGGAGDTTIRAGDLIGIHPANGEAFTKTVPAMSVALNHEARAVSGSAPPATRVFATVFASDGQELFSDLLDVDQAGHYSLTLPAEI